MPKKTHHTLKVHNIEGIRYSFTHLSTTQGWMVNFTPQMLPPRERTLVPTEQETGWTPEPVWTFPEKKKYLTPTGIWTPNRPARSLVTTSNTLRYDVNKCNERNTEKIHTWIHKGKLPLRKAQKSQNTWKNTGKLSLIKISTSGLGLRKFYEFHVCCTEYA